MCTRAFNTSDSKYAKWSIQFTTDKEPKKVARGKQGKHSTESKHWCCLLCLIQAIDEDKYYEEVEKIATLNMGNKEERKYIQDLLVKSGETPIVESSNKINIKVLPPSSSVHGNWHQHFSKKHKLLFPTTKATEEQKKEAKRLLSPFEDKAKRMCSKLFKKKKKKKQSTLNFAGEVQEQDVHNAFDNKKAQYLQTLWLMKHGRPSTQTEDSALREFLDFVTGGKYKHQSRMTESRKEFDIYAQARLLFVQKLKEAKTFFGRIPFVSVEGDGWSSQSGTCVFAVCVRFFVPSMKRALSAVLEAKELKVGKTAKELEALVRETLGTFGIRR